MISTRQKAIGAAAVGLLLVAAVALSYGLQLHASSAPFQSVSAATATPPRPAHSYIYSDATSVQFLSWSATGTGAIDGVVYEVQDISPGSPSFLTSTLAWAGTRTGQELTISIPGATTQATLKGNTLVRQEMDSRTGTLVTETWVAGTLANYSTLTQAFRDYILLGQDLKGITFVLQSAQQFPDPWAGSQQLQPYLQDAEEQLAALGGLSLPHLPGLLTLWVISPQQINSTLQEARSLLSTATAGATAS
jgi:hypothetical protein